MCERTWNVMKWFIAGAILSTLGGIGSTVFLHYVVGP